MAKKDLLLELKQTVLLLNIKHYILRQYIVLLDLCFHEVQDDINIAESFSNLLEINDVNVIDLININKEVSSSTEISMTDMYDVIDYLNEDIDLECEIINNIVSGIDIVNNYIYNEDIFVLMMENYLDIDEFCYKQAKTNQKQLKKINEERMEKIK